MYPLLELRNHKCKGHERVLSSYYFKTAANLVLANGQTGSVMGKVTVGMTDITLAMQ